MRHLWRALSIRLDLLALYVLLSPCSSRLTNVPLHFEKKGMDLAFCLFPSGEYNRLYPHMPSLKFLFCPFAFIRRKLRRVCSFRCVTMAFFVICLLPFIG